MSYVKPGPLKRETEDRYISEKQDRARRSTETFRAVTSTTSMDKPFYWSKIDSGVHKAAIYNDTEPKVRFFTDGIEVATVHINRGESFTDCFYDEGCDHTISYVWRDMGYSGSLGFDVRLSQTSGASCKSVDGASCICRSVYTVYADGREVDGLNYVWSVDGATIILGQSTKSIEVESTGIADTEFIVSCVVSDSYTSSDVSRGYTHSRYSTWADVVINSLVELSPGSCNHVYQDTCLATSGYYVDATNVVQYSWSVEGGDIVSGQGTSAIVVETIDNVARVLKVKCICVGNDSVEIIEDTYIHRRVDTYVPVSNLAIVEVVHGSCNYQTGNECTAFGQYQVTYDGTPTEFQWGVDGGTIVSGQGTDLLIVETTSNMNVIVNLTCYVRDLFTVLSVSDNYVHTRTEASDPVAITSLTEDVVGSCEYNIGSTCIAQSQYTVVGTDYDTIVWNVTNGVIESGQGSTSIVVSTDSDQDVDVTIQVVLTGFLGGTVNTSGVYSHTRTEVVLGLTLGLVAHYLLNNNADDNHGAFDGVDVGTVEYQGDQLDPLAGSVTIPNSSASSCSYWKDSGSGMVFTYTTTIITSLATDNYSNLRMYSDTKDASFQADLLAEGYYPKPLTEPTTTGLVAHYPLTGTAEDSTGNYDGTEVGVTYVDNSERGSMVDFDGSTNYITTPLTRPNIMTISCIIDVANDTTLRYHIGDNNNANGYSNGFSIAASNARGFIMVGDGTQQVAISLSTTVPGDFAGIHHMLAEVNVTTGAISLSLDGGEYYASDVSPAITITNTLSLGCQGDTYRKSLNNLQNVRVYDRYLTAQEKLDIYNYEKNFRPIDIDDGLVAYYPLANNSLDNYYNEYDGTDGVNVAYVTDAEFGSVHDVNGGSDADEITLPYSTLVSAPFSVSFWYKNDTPLVDTMPIGRTNNTSYLALFQGSGTFYCSVGSGGYISSTLNQDGEWHHYNIVIDELSSSFHEDGISKTITANTTTGSEVFGNAKIGSSTSDSYPATGLMKNLRFYNKALTPEQIKVIYDSEKLVV